MLQMISEMKPATPLSIRGTGDVATMMSGLANLLDCKFENDGVQVQLSNPYFPGRVAAVDSPTAAEHQSSQNSAGGTLAIWPLNGARGRHALINSASGMISYATSSNGVSFKTLFNPSIGWWASRYCRVASATRQRRRTTQMFRLARDGRAIGIVACAAAAGS